MYGLINYHEDCHYYGFHYDFPWSEVHLPSDEVHFLRFNSHYRGYFYDFPLGEVHFPWFGDHYRGCFGNFPGGEVH